MPDCHLLFLQERTKDCKQIIFLTLICLLSFHNLLAQTTSPDFVKTCTIKGRVKDSTNDIALGYVTVGLIEKTLVEETKKTTLSKEDGSFSISVVPKWGQYRLILSYVGYESQIIQLSHLTVLNLDLGVIALAPIATKLQEVEVTALKPIVEQNLNKLIYNVADDPEVNVLSTLDMLRKVPSLTVDEEDNLQLNGMGNLQILVNGKRSALFTANPSEALKNLPASVIKKVEVVTDPSAKYEASGIGGVINIITHKKDINGYNGSLSLGAGSPGEYNGSGSFTAKAGKVSLLSRYSNNNNNNPSNRSRFYRIDKTRGNKLQQRGHSEGESKSNNAGGELTYQLSPLDLVTASFNMNRNEGTHSHNQLVRQINAIGETTEAYQNRSKSDNKGSAYDISLDYQRIFPKNDLQNLSLTFNLLNSDVQSSSDFTLLPLLNYTDRASITLTHDRAKEYNLQADYIHPLGKKTLEVGIKSIFQKNSSNYSYANIDAETGTYLMDSSLSNNFNYDQNMHAAYISLNLRKGNWGFRTGLRLEETHLNVDFRSTATQADQLYRNLFPNVTLSRRMKESGTLKFSYTQRMERPGLYDLNPYVDATDPQNISYGNPELDPAKTHVFQLEHTKLIKATSFSTTLFHHFTQNTIQHYTRLGEDSIARTTLNNLGKNWKYGLMLHVNTTLLKKLTMNVSGGTHYLKYASELEGKLQQREGFDFSLRGTTSFRFGKGWRASSNLSYTSPNILLQGKSGGYTWSTVSLNKQFLKNDKANITLSVRSPFTKNRKSVYEIDNSAFYQLRESYSVVRQYNVSLNYRFGKLQ